MAPKSQKTNPNVALQIAIVQSGLKRYVIARRARLTPDRLSKITRGRLPATDSEQRALARVLDRQVHEIFQTESLAVSA